MKLCLELSYFHTYAHHNYFTEKKTHVDIDSLLNFTISVHGIRTVLSNAMSIRII
jgi:hypothetical protein